jgi:hypothetical protein
VRTIVRAFTFSHRSALSFSRRASLQGQATQPEPPCGYGSSTCISLPRYSPFSMCVSIDQSISGCVVRASRNIVHGIRTALLSVQLFAACVAVTDLSVIHGVLAVDRGRPRTAAS